MSLAINVSESRRGPQLDQFGDFRIYLLAHAQEMKLRYKKWTYGSWAKRIGLKNTSSLTKILQGQRSAGTKATEAFIRYFNFSKSDAEYFRGLVQFDKVKNNPKVKLDLLESLSRGKGAEAIKLLETELFAIISNWYCLPIRELVRLGAIKTAAEDFVGKFYFKLNKYEARSGLNALLKAGLLEEGQNGELKVGHARLSTGSDVSVEAIKRFHEQMLTHAKEAVRKFGVDEREFSSSSIAISSNNLPRAKELIREFRQKFNALMENDGRPDGVYQFQIQLFPIAHHKEDLK